MKKYFYKKKIWISIVILLIVINSVFTTKTFAEENTEAPNRTFTLRKVFIGIDKIPSDFTLDYSAVCGEYKCFKECTLSNAYSIAEDSMCVEWNVPYYYNMGNNNEITIIEHADIEGYTYEVQPSYGSANGNTIIFVINAMMSGATRTITNSYYPDEPSIPIEPETPDDGRLYTITVENEMPGHTYNSYQVFGGNFSEGRDNQGNTIPILSNITWGVEFQKVATNETSKTYGDKLIEVLKEKCTKNDENKSIYDDCKTAEDVASVLIGKPKDGEEIREFAKFVGEFIKENNIKLTKGTSTQVIITEGGMDKKVYRITELKPGYYVVIDEKAELSENDAYSRYLLDVVQDITMKPKTSLPTLSKKVIGDNLNKMVKETSFTGEDDENVTEIQKTEIDYTRNTAMYKENGEYDITFELTSNIPKDLDKYEQYDYEIVDILSKGFDIDKNSVEVTVGGESYIGYIVEEPIKINADNYETNKHYFKENGTVNPEDNYEKTIILIKFNKLVEHIKDKIILEGQDIVVTYNAKLNIDAETGKKANENEAYLLYTSNPYDLKQKGTTNSSKTYTYTIELNLTKIAEIENNNMNTIEESTMYKYLAGAKFEIYDEPEYIINDETGKNEKNETRELVATITSSDFEENKGFTKYKSLKNGTYYIKEVESPSGYNKLKEEIEFIVSAEYKDLDIIWRVEDKTTSKLVEIKIDETGNKILMQVENTSGFQLPETGGRGTIAFIVLGLSLMLLAVVSIKTKRKIK